MRLREVIDVLNQMQNDSIIGRYAIGGAVGATFYVEPAATLDVDVFVELHAQSESPILDLRPIFKYLENRGGVMEREYVVFADTPIQFITPPPGSLSEEAILQAVTKDIDGLPVSVFSAEHLAALALETGRTKDKLRLLALIEQGSLNTDRLHDIICRHNLSERWEKFEQQFLSEPE